MTSRAWSQGMSVRNTSTTPSTCGSITTLRPLIRANVRRTARRSAFWKSRDTGLAGGERRRLRLAAGLRRRGGRARAPWAAEVVRAEQRYQDQRSEISHAYRSSCAPREDLAHLAPGAARRRVARGLLEHHGLVRHRLHDAVEQTLRAAHDVRPFAGSLEHAEMAPPGTNQSPQPRARRYAPRPARAGGRRRRGPAVGGGPRGRRTGRGVPAGRTPRPAARPPGARPARGGTS